MIKMKLLPLIKRYIKIFVSMSLILALGVMLLIGLMNGCHSFDVSVSSWLIEKNFPELTVITEPFFPSLSKPVENTYTRLVYDALVANNSGRLITGRCFFETPDALGRYYETEHSIDSVDGVVNAKIDHFIFNMGGLSLGDRISVNCGVFSFDAVVTSVLTGPENFVVYRNAFNIYDRTDFGYIYFDSDEVMSATGLAELPQNEFLVSDKAHADSIFRKISDNYSVISSFTIEESPQRVQADINIKPIRLLSSILPSIVFVIAVIVSSLFMIQIIQEQRQEIGLLRALGYSSKSIVALYAIFELIVSLTALIIGGVLGMFLGRFILSLYCKTFCILDIAIDYRLTPYVVSAIAVIALGQMSAIGCALMITRVDPTEAMRSVRTEKTQKDLSLHGIPEIAKMQLRFAIRNSRRTAVTVFCISITGILLCFSLSYSEALNAKENDTLSTRYRFDAQICFSDMATADEMADRLNGIEYIDDMEFAAYQIADISFNGATESVMLCGLQTDADMVRVLDESGNELAMNADGVYVEYHTAEQLNIESGDVISINGHDVCVSGICYQDMQYVQYMPLNFFETIAGDGAFSCAFVDISEGVAESELNDVLPLIENFDYVTYTRTIKDGILFYISASRPASGILLACGLAIGLLIIYNITVINFGERKRNYAILMTQGTSKAFIVLSTFAELFLEYVLSLIITAVVGIPAAKLLLDNLKTPQTSFRNPHIALTFVSIAILVFAYMALANVLAMSQIRKIDLANSLKEKE